MQNGPTDLDLDHDRAGRRGSGINRWLDHQRHEGRDHIHWHHQLPLARKTVPSGKVPDGVSVDGAGETDAEGQGAQLLPAEPGARSTPRAPSLLVRHEGLLGRALLDQPASKTTSVLIQFEGAERVAEVPLAEVALVELLRD